MSADDRVAVKTYVPQYQKQEWKDHADELEMSTSEFVRTMVQAGRSDIALPDGRSPAGSGEPSDSRAPSHVVSDGSSGFKPRIEAVLGKRGALEWDELVDALVDDVESELDEALQDLQAENAVVYSGRIGGYTLVDDE